MANYPTDVYGPADSAPKVTGIVAVCKVCGFEWQVRSFAGTDAKGCGFCGAPEEAIRTYNEEPGYGYAVRVP
jgi:hypothetical protein